MTARRKIAAAPSGSIAKAEQRCFVRYLVGASRENARRIIRPTLLAIDDDIISHRRHLFPLRQSDQGALHKEQLCIDASARACICFVFTSPFDYGAEPDHRTQRVFIKRLLPVKMNERLVTGNFAKCNYV
jgi:hypothetical protein